MKKITWFSFILLALINFYGCQNSSKSTSVKISNNSETLFSNVLIKLDISELKDKIDLSQSEKIIVISDSIIPCQINDYNKDEVPDKLVFLCSLKPGEKKEIEIKKACHEEEIKKFSKKTQAEISIKTGGEWKDRKYIDGTFENVSCLRVPDEHTDHSYFIRYEGPGWESDMVGYRFYLDWRNAIDIFGKIVDTMVLQNVGQDGFDSYHEMADWGMDILKVGSSLGIGSIGIWEKEQAQRVAETDSVTCKIVKDGIIESKIKTKYYGWKVGDDTTDLTSYLSIHAGSRLTKHKIKLSNSVDSISTGIVKHENGVLINSEQGEGDWAYMATYGEQSLANDHLGMAILYNKNDLIKIDEDEYSHVVVLKPTENKLNYYFLAAWEKELNGIKSKEEFIEYLNNEINKLNNPPEIIY